MDMTAFVDLVGEPEAAALAGLLVGAIFGLSAERSRFCLRAAAVEVARGGFGPRLAVWLLAFSTAALWTQALDMAGMIDLGRSRWLASPGTISGAVIGGLVFGVGMVLARGCPGRLLVLGATGNLRAILSGLVFAVFAQMSLRGALSPAREWLSAAWATEGPNPHLLSAAGLPGWAGIAVAALFAAAALLVAARNRVGAGALLFGCGVGFAAACGWALTFALSEVAFDPVPVGSLTFSGPSADVLMFVLGAKEALDFDVGLVPGVALAAFASAALAGRLRWEGWDGAAPMRRYLLGAALMGFGAMTAGGCTIGAGVTGGSTFALTAWAALTAMWAGGMIADRIVDGGEREAQPPRSSSRSISARFMARSAST